MTDGPAALHRILNHHDEACRAFRAASAAFTAAAVSLRPAFDGLMAAQHAQGQAITALQAANREALALLNREEEDR